MNNIQKGKTFIVKIGELDDPLQNLQEIAMQDSVTLEYAATTIPLARTEDGWVQSIIDTLSGSINCSGLMSYDLSDGTLGISKLYEAFYNKTMIEYSVNLEDTGDDFSMTRVYGRALVVSIQANADTQGYASWAATFQLVGKPELINN